MKKSGERLIEQKGFTLVELIVVIVIILILAAVLIPSVMRFIGSARKSAFQNEASSYLTELSGFEAEWYAGTGKDLDDGSDHGLANALPFGSNMAMTDWDTDDSLYIYKSAKVDDALKRSPAHWIYDGCKTIMLSVNEGVVNGFIYCDGRFGVNWFPEQGWSDIVEKE